MQLISVEPGRAVIAMTITDRMVNGHHICHGGYIFTLADSAFAFACNTYDQRRVAQHCAITFVNPGKLGDRLAARRREAARRPLRHLRHHGHARRRQRDRGIPRVFAHDRRRAFPALNGGSK